MQFFKKETLKMVFSFKFRGIFENTVFIEDLQKTASNSSYFATCTFQGIPLHVVSSNL